MSVTFLLVIVVVAAAGLKDLVGVTFGGVTLALSRESNSSPNFKSILILLLMPVNL